MVQVTEATGGNVRLRALVSANDAAALWDLRCLVREKLVAWIWQHQRGAVPRMRAEVESAAPQPVMQRPMPRADLSASSDAARVFGGDGDGNARGVTFGGPDGSLTTRP